MERQFKEHSEVGAFVCSNILRVTHTSRDLPNLHSISFEEKSRHQPYGHFAPAHLL
jgi:hypothetical protein